MSSQSRTAAFLSYLLPLVGPAYALGVRRDDSFARYHGAQALAAQVSMIAAPLLWAVAAWALAWVPAIGPVLGLGLFGLVIAFEFMMVAALVMGMVAALRGRWSALPVVGERAERLFGVAAPLPAQPEPAAEALPPAVEALPETEPRHS